MLAADEETIGDAERCSESRQDGFIYLLARFEPPNRTGRHLCYRC
jgi:hypothetical protein